MKKFFTFISIFILTIFVGENKDLINYKLEKSINWYLAIVKEVHKFSAIIETEDNLEGVIEYKDISWTKKEFKDLLRPGDIIYVKYL